LGGSSRPEESCSALVEANNRMKGIEETIEQAAKAQEYQKLVS